MNIKSFKTLSFIVAMATIILIPQSACNESSTIFVDCDYCYSYWPDYEEAKLSLTISDENPYVPITVYNGPYEDGNILYRDTAYDETHYIIIDTDKYLTLKAEYRKDARPYYVISGTRLKVKKDEDTCTEPCYYVTGGNIDLRMKF